MTAKKEAMIGKKETSKKRKDLRKCPTGDIRGGMLIRGGLDARKPKVLKRAAPIFLSDLAPFAGLPRANLAVSPASDVLLKKI